MEHHKEQEEDEGQDSESEKEIHDSKMKKSMILAFSKSNLKEDEIQNLALVKKAMNNKDKCSMDLRPIQDHMEGNEKEEKEFA